MKMLGICAILYLMTICVVDVCDAKCDDYITVFEEITCPTYYKLTPLKLNQNEWDEVCYPSNLTDKNPEKKKCVLEFNCLGTSASCFDRIKVTHHHTRSIIAGNNTKALANSTTKPLVLPKSNITEKPNHTVNEEIETSMCDVKLFFINTNDMQNSSEITNKKSKTQQHIIFCDYAETICINEENPEYYSSNDAKNVTNHTRHNEAGELDITINRDENSPIQPIFTGYFNDSNYKSDGGVFKDFKTVDLQCKILEDNNCKGNFGNKSIKQVNIYIKTNYVQNNTITKYPNCTKYFITSNNLHHVIKCEDILFAKHNKHILFTPQLNNKPKPESSTWNCQIIDLNNTLISSKQQNSETSKIYFKNCSNDTSNNKNKSEALIAAPISDQNRTTDNIIARDDIQMNKTEIASGKTELMNDNLTLTSPVNRLTVLITEKANNCSQHYTSLSINEGKIIDLGINNNKEKILVNNIVELNLSNCINVNSSIINNTQIHPKTELVIILKNESLNTSNLKIFNGPLKGPNVKQSIIIRCDRPNRDINSNTTSNKTELECESIDLAFYNITGIEISTDLSQTTNNKTAIKSVNKTKQELTWNCKIIELNYSSSTKEQHSANSEIYFKNCYDDINISNSKSESKYHNVMPIPGNNNGTIDSILTNNDIKMNKTEIHSGKTELNNDNLTRTSPGNRITLLITEKANNCSQNYSSLRIHEGKIIDLGINNNKENILANNILELKLSNCVNVKTSIINNAAAELIIILKNESLSTSNLKLFNGTPKEGNVKQRIILRCNRPNRDISSNNTSNKTELECESIELNDFRGIENSTDQTSNANNTKEQKRNNVNIVGENHNQINLNADANKNSNFSTNKTVESNEGTVNNKSNANNIKLVENKEVQNINSESKDKSKKLNFNRKKDIADGAGQNSLALESAETEKIMLIALLSIAGGSILIVIMMRAWPKKSEYDPTPTRDPPDDEETAF